METPKQMGSDEVAPQQGSTTQQQGSQQGGPRRDDKKPSGQMQGTQFTDWASI